MMLRAAKCSACGQQLSMPKFKVGDLVKIRGAKCSACGQQLSMPKFKIGDRVKIRGVSPRSPEYDEGTVVAFTVSQCQVHWSDADEVYDENPDELDPLGDGGPTAARKKREDSK